MRSGCQKEIKDKEGRVALTPAGAKRLCEAGHAVLVEERAGMGSGFSDEGYRTCGAAIVSADLAWDAALVLKVKEPTRARVSVSQGPDAFYLPASRGCAPQADRGLAREQDRGPGV